MKTKTVPIKIPTDLYNELQEILVERSLSIEDAAIMYLRSMVKGVQSSRCMDLHDRMPFGKYQGSTVETLIKAQPDYISWLLSNSKSFQLEVSALELLKDVLA